MLKGEIKRDFQHNYLVFPASKERTDYQMQMLVHQKIQGVLPCMIRRVDGRQLFSYDISQKVSMKQKFQEQELGHEEIEAFLQTLGNIVEDMKDYLLEMELLVLLPEYIFYEESTKQWFFVCFPREGENIYTSFHELSKYFLTILNHKEEKAVQLGYSLYRSTMNENFSFGQVLAQVQERPSSQKLSEGNLEPRTVQREGEPKEFGKNRQETKNGSFMEPQPRVENQQTTGIQPRAETQQRMESPQRDKKAGFLSNGSGKQKRTSVVRKKEKKEKKRKNYEYGRTPQMSAYAAEGGFAYGNCQCILKGITKPKGSLQIKSFPYLIGSLEYAVDGYIDSSEVGHFHARMEMEGNEYYIIDLDSPSGTYVNGQNIVHQAPQRLSEGDRISFGNTEFVFEIGQKC